MGSRLKPPGEWRAYLRRKINPLLGAALLLLAFHAAFGAHGLLAMYRTRQEVKRMQQDIQKLNEENRRLSEQANSLKSDPVAIEHIAREEMGLARPGELVFKLPPKPGDKNAASQPNKSTGSNPSAP